MSDRHLTTLGKEVPVSDVDRELKAFFAADEEGLTRASLMNFAIYTEAPVEEGIRNAEIIRQLTEDNACRAILLIAQTEDAPDGRRARAWIDAHCNLGPGGEKAVCTEQVAFVLSGANTALVNNTLFAHLDSDLPLIFWWRGELSPVFGDRLYSRIGRLLFDSRDWSSPGVSFTRLNEAMEDDSADFVPHDLSYTRGNPIRRAIVNAFNDPRARQAAPTLSKVQITHGPGQHMAALWLVAWIAERLKAELNEGASREGRFVFDRHRNFLGGTMQMLVELKETEESVQDAAITEVVLENDNGDAQVSVARATTAGFWKVHINVPGCEGTVEELLPARLRNDADLVAEILMRAGKNRSMLSVLPTLRAMLAL